MRQAGLGRLVYHLYYRPLGALARSVREGGPLEQYRTAAGRRAMASAAGTLLPTLPAPPATAPEIHFLTGRHLWFQTAFLLNSLSRFIAVRPVIHDDGTLDGAPAAQLRRIVPFARFPAAGEIDARLERDLSARSHPTLRERRGKQVLFRKLIDVHLGATGPRLFLDSDMLVFARPERIIEWLRAPTAELHMTDVAQAYGYEPSLMERLAGQPVPDLVNTGVLGLHSERIDWDRMEWWCRSLIEHAGTNYYQEQALTALHLSGQPHVALPQKDYLVLPTVPEALACRAVMHHYVAGSKRWYFQHNWRRFGAGRP